jgi:hypothetical protein
MGKIEGQQVLDSNDWEKVKKSGEFAVKSWINRQMDNMDAVIVLVGSQTANRKWVNYEISRAWDNKKPIIGLYINKLKNKDGEQSSKGENPFKYITLSGGDKLDKYIPCINPVGTSSSDTYCWIKENIDNITTQAIARK